MRILALLRVAWLTEASYRLNVVLQFGGLAISLVPLFFIANALQPLAQESIRTEGEQYYGFLLVGIGVMYYLGFAVRSLPAAIESGIRTGTLEALLATPTRLSTLLSGLVAFPFVQTTARAAVLVIALWVGGAPLAWHALPSATLIVALIVAAHFPVGLFAAALQLAFRTSGPLATAVVLVSTLFGGVYYSTTAIPDVIQPLSVLVPITYGLRALRRTLLTGEPLAAVATDVMVLAAVAVVATVVGVVTLRAALSYARRAGTLAQY